MLRSSVKLIEKLALASVLVPQTPPPPAGDQKGSGALSDKTVDLTHLLAVYSTDALEGGIDENPDCLLALKMEGVLKEVLR